jgi:hypothetical protein
VAAERPGTKKNFSSTSAKSGVTGGVEMVSVDITFCVHFPSRSSDQPSFICQKVSGARSAAVEMLVRAPKSLAVTAVLGDVCCADSAVKMKIRWPYTM